jgi:hypothetical protein
VLLVDADILSVAACRAVMRATGEHHAKPQQSSIRDWVSVSTRNPGVCDSP